MSQDTNILKIFDNIYTTTHEWGGEDNLSGAGSTLENTVLYRQFLDNFISSNKIKSILDLGCGDFEVMRTLKNIGNVKYIGIDASKYIINKNKRLYGDFNKIFVHGAIADMNLPNYDLVIIKDVLQHLSNENIIKILDHMKTYKYIIIVNDIDNHTNEDIEDG
jgi:2-polyprenyl-3-methyl-5-hydroxy-6-metoxy-1,4-benzoquinol methylase